MQKTRVRRKTKGPAVQDHPLSDSLDPSLEEIAKARIENGFSVIEGLLRQVRKQLNADAVTVAVRRGGDEQLLVCGRNGEVRAAEGSLSLGLVSNGPSRLTGGAGLLQAVECCTLFGFVPSGYLGAPFERPSATVRGGIAAWTRRPRRWGVDEGTLLRKLASFTESQM